MVKPLTLQQVGTTAVVTGMLLASGCRSSSIGIGSGPVPTPGQSYFNDPPFYRSYERMVPRNGGNPVQTPVPAPQPTPPSVLPNPGYSEPELPPSPSAKRSRWNLVPSVFSRASNNEKTEEIRQSAGRNDRGRPSKLNPVDAAESISMENAVEETVPSRFSAPKDNRLSAKPQPIVSSNNDVAGQTSLPALGVPDSSNAEILSNGPIKTRFGVIRPWPGSTTSYKSRSDSARDTESDSAGEMPLLLPPSD